MSKLSGCNPTEKYPDYGCPFPQPPISKGECCPVNMFVEAGPIKTSDSTSIYYTIGANILRDLPLNIENTCSPLISFSITYSLRKQEPNANWIPETNINLGDINEIQPIINNINILPTVNSVSSLYLIKIRRNAILQKLNINDTYDKGIELRLTMTYQCKGKSPVKKEILLDIPPFSCKKALQIFNTNTDGSIKDLGNQNSKFEYLRINRIPEYRIGRSDFSFEFWLDINIPSINRRNLIFRWEAIDQTENPPGRDDETSIALFRMPDNTLEWNFSKRWTGSGYYSTVRSSISLIPGELYHIVVMKSTNNANNYRIYINGVDRTVLPPISNNIPIGADNLDYADGCLAFGAEWSAVSTSQTNPTLFQPYASRYVISNIRFYSRLLTDNEIQANNNAGCLSNPTDMNGLLMWYDLNQSSGNTVASKLAPPLDNPAILVNYPSNRTEPDSNNSAWTSICCE